MAVFPAWARHSERQLVAAAFTCLSSESQVGAAAPTCLHPVPVGLLSNCHGLGGHRLLYERSLSHLRTRRCVSWVGLGGRHISKADETLVRKFDLGLCETDKAKWGVERLSRFLENREPKAKTEKSKKPTSGFLGRPKH